MSHVEPHACSLLDWGLQPMLGSASPTVVAGFLFFHTASDASLHLMVWVLLGLNSSPWKQDREVTSDGVLWELSYLLCRKCVQGVDVINLRQLLSLQISGPCWHSGVQLLL